MVCHIDGTPAPKAGALPLGSPSFSISFLKTKGLSKEFGSGRVYENVAPHAWTPPNFPHSEEETKALSAHSNGNFESWSRLCEGDFRPYR